MWIDLDTVLVLKLTIEAAVWVSESCSLGGCVAYASLRNSAVSIIEGLNPSLES